MFTRQDITTTVQRSTFKRVPRVRRVVQLRDYKAIEIAQQLNKGTKPGSCNQALTLINWKHDPLQINEFPSQKTKIKILCLLYSSSHFTFMRFLWAAVKEGIPSNDELEHLSVEVDDWGKLGRRLGFTPAELTALHKDKEKWSEKAFAMLMKWKEKKASSATYRCLYDALSHELMNRREMSRRSSKPEG